jgi:hypothetical protein
MTDGQRLQKCPARIRDRFHHFRYKQHATQTEDTCHHAMAIVPLHYDIWSGSPRRTEGSKSCFARRWGIRPANDEACLTVGQ